MEYDVLAYYHFCTIEDPVHEVELHKTFCEKLDIKGRIYISEEGINGQMSAFRPHSKLYMEWMKERPLFSSMPFKLHEWHEQAFEKLTIKYRKQLVAFDEKIDMKLTGVHLSPEEWAARLEEKPPEVLIDTRNDYEWEVGRFAGAERPSCATFRDFKRYAQELKEKVNPSNTPVMMYCTGGIRCEVYSAYLRQEGFNEVYQLEGGIINYGLKKGGSHWEGKLFVFDDRMTVPISTEETPTVGKCHCCETPADSYYNCANMDCNHLFICCPTCLHTLQGCCCPSCKEAPRVRPYHHQNPHKPFRKRHTYRMA